MSARTTLTTASPKFVQRLIAARATLAKHRWSSVQDFCVGLADPSVHELIRRCFNGGQLLLNGGERLRAVMNFFRRSRSAPAKFGRCDRALRKELVVKDNDKVAVPGNVKRYNPVVVEYLYNIPTGIFFAPCIFYTANSTPFINRNN